MEQKAFLKSFVKSINVSRSEITINYTLPMPPLNTDKETLGVLAFIQNGEPDLLKDRTSRSEVLSFYRLSELEDTVAHRSKLFHFTGNLISPFFVYII